MARNRVIYQSEALFTSESAEKTASGDMAQLQRVQSANYSFSVARQDVNQYGQLGRIDSIMLEAPTVSFDTSYLLGDGHNESALGFSISESSGCLGANLSTTSGQNIYIVTAAEGEDLNLGAATTAANSVIGIGHAFVTDYSLDASVGSIPTVSVSMEALNINSDITIDGNASAGFTNILSPSIEDLSNPAASSTPINLPAMTTGTSAVTALRPGDISITFGNILSDAELGPICDISGDADGAHVQSVSINFGLSRSPIERLGAKMPFARTVDTPISATMSVSAIVNESSVKNLISSVEDEAGTDIKIVFNDQDGAAKFAYTLKGARLASESISSSIGSNKAVDLTFECAIGGPNDVTNNLLFSGAASNAF
jgi:hypothetical protein